MEVVFIIRKGKYLDTMGKYYIYQETFRGTQINDKNAILRNILFDTLKTSRIPGRGLKLS
jgi:hypothetical protein